MSHDLQRFVAAQEGIYDQALAELRNGRKTSHWMWFVFPQIQGLGRSGMAQRYAISDLEEAKAYLEHPTLGPRLRECAGALTQLDETDATRVMGGIDALKLKSSMTLFNRAAQDDVFQAVLQQYFDGEEDELTLERL